MAIKDVILGYAKGDKGDRGPQGEKGATGATGPKGEPGNIADAQITDTEGLDVAKGQKTTAQKLFDAIANRIVTKLVTNDALTKKLADYMLKGMMSNTNVNNTGTVPTSALMYSMFEQINSDLFTYERNFEGKDLNTIIIPGCYGCGGKPSTYGSTNYPEDTTGMLVVFSNTGVTVQHYYTYLGALYLRSKLLNYNEWSSWEKITK